jgi:metallo-beta-lactamase class B
VPRLHLLIIAGLISPVFLFPVFLSAAPVKAQADETSRSWNVAVKPFKVIGNIYYVGANEITSFLITTPKGHILLDGGFAETVPLIKESLKQLGFRLEDIKILINSQGHYDHAGGLALLKELTKASLVVSKADAELISNGGKGDFAWGDKLTFQPVKADRLLDDRDEIELGGVTMTARLTPGHTKGCTTWTMKVKEGGKQYAVVFLGSTTAPGYRLVDNLLYPNIAADYAYTFKLLKSIECDVFLASHGSFFALDHKRRRLERGAKPNPFIDPEGYKTFLAKSEEDYLRELRKQQSEKARQVSY